MIRFESKDDREAVRNVHASAFEGHTEVKLFALLNEQARPLVSLLAEEEDECVGHILFSPASLHGHPDLNIMGLAPMSVLPGYQGQGIGSALVREGLDQCRKQGVDAVIVLGHPDYYPRFGFRPAARYGIESEYEVPDEAFMVLELQPGVLQGRSGRVEYHPAFKQL